MNIWIINHYAGDMFLEKGGRHYWIAKYLNKKGYSVSIFCSNNKHNPSNEKFFETNDLMVKKLDQSINTTFIFVKTRKYQGNGIDRIKNMLDFYINVKKAAKLYANEVGAPNIIIPSSVHPFSLVGGIQLAKKYHTRCICEIRDLWPESLVAYKVAGRNHPFVIFLRLLEKWIYKRADSLVFTMEGAYEYIKKQKWDKDIPRRKVFLINNGVDLEEYTYNKINHTIEDKDLSGEGYFKVVYTGSIRKANNIGKLVDAAKMMDNKRVKILIWGNGEEFEHLKNRVKNENISNVFFKGRVDKASIPYILSQSDANFLDPFDESVSQYGISSNKLFEYFAAGKPILMNEMHSFIPGGESPCKFYYSDTPESIVSALNSVMALDSEEYTKACEAAKKIADSYSFLNLTEDLISIIEEKL